MKRNLLGLIFIGLLSSLIFTGCEQGIKADSVHAENAAATDTRIFLYGERHGVEIILEKEVELWEEYYNQGFRHLFIEMGASFAESLNICMKQQDNHLIDELHACLEGTLSFTKANHDFYVAVKKRCPETVWHGTDVDHQYDSIGQAYLDYLKSEGMENSDEYKYIEKNMEQAVHYYNDEKLYDVEAYRENCMVENFKYEFDKLPEGTKIMGIYGSAHTNKNGKNWETGKVPSMANQLEDYYQEKEGVGIFTRSIAKLKK